MTPLLQFFTAREGSARRDLFTLTALFGFALFFRLGALPLIDPDEGRYAEIPREMLERGDFITPHLNYVKYFEKPPLHYWLDALSFKLFGLNEFAARLPGALMALVGILFTYHLGRRCFGRKSGLYGALVLGSSLGWLVIGRYNVIDMTLSVCMTLALGCFLLASRPEERHPGRYYYLFYLFAALTVLAKGLIGLVLPGGIILFQLLLTGRWRLLKEMRLPTGIALFLLVGAPWFVAVSLRNPEFARFFFIHEHFERFLTKVHGRYEPPWFFIPVLVGFMLPWSLFIPATVRGIWRERRTAAGEARLYLLLWSAIIFVFFSLSDSKLVPYILPIFPAVALLIGDLFDRCVERPAGLRLPAWLAAGLLTIGGIGVALYPFLAQRPRFSVTDMAIIGGILLVEGVAALLLLSRRALPATLVAFCLMSYLLAVAGAPRVLARTAERKSSKELGLLARAKAGPETVLATFGMYRQGLSYYAERRVVLVNNRNELDFGSKIGDQSAWFIKTPAFIALWNSPTQVIAMIGKDDLAKLAPQLTKPPQLLGSQQDVLLVANY